MKKIFVRTSLISFIFWYGVFSTSMPLVILAESGNEDNTVITSQEDSTDNSEIDNIDDNGEKDNNLSSDGNVSVETGDAGSGATSVTNANSAETVVPGNLEGGTCSGPETDCAVGTEVDTDQTADVETDSSSQADSGDNNVEASGSADLNTGDAYSQAASISTSNTDVVDLENGDIGNGEESTASGQKEEDIADESDLSSSSSTKVIGSTSSIEVNTEQIADSDVNSEAESVSGGNEVQATGSADVVTGTAVAVANSINTANINLVGSDFVWLIENVLGQEEKTFNFYDLILSMLRNSNGDLPQDILINTDQTSNLSTSTLATSNTGKNDVEGDGVDLTTGDAVAVANTVNLTNLNLIGTNGIFAVLNIIGTLVGDIIIPNLSQLGPSGFPWGNVNVVTEQNADLKTETGSVSSSGENSLEESGDLTTGDAVAVANSYSFANLVKIGDNWQWIIFNLYGNWDGHIENLEGPGEDSKLQGIGTYDFSDEWQGENDGVENENGGGSLTIRTTQDASVESTTLANSNTGENNLTGDGELSTGDAYSVSNDFTLANMVGVGGSMVFGIFNIVGNWFGNFIVAYPDLSVSITDNVDYIEPGSSWKYQITVINNGDAWARGVKLSYDLPSDFVSSGSNRNEIVLDDIGPGESVNYEVGGNVSSTALANSEVLASVSVISSDTEESLDNNKSTDSTVIFVPSISEPENSDTTQEDHTLPKLEVSVWSNVNEFVYPGDTVLAAITVTNQSPVIAKSVRVIGSLSNDHPMPPIPMSWDLGDLRPGEKVTIQFGIGLINDLPGGVYHLTAEAFGSNLLGEEVSSGRVVSDFNVFLKKVADFLSPDVKAKGLETEGLGETLGLSTNDSVLDFRKYFPYLLGASVFTLLLITGGRRKLQSKPVLPVFKRRRENKDE